MFRSLTSFHIQSFERHVANKSSSPETLWHTGIPLSVPSTYEFRHVGQLLSYSP